jgi:flagellar basal body-associated protein FliL
MTRGKTAWIIVIIVVTCLLVGGCLSVFIYKEAKKRLSRPKPPASRTAMAVSSPISASLKAEPPSGCATLLQQA